MDPVDAIMVVMHEAFDPAYGEGWTRAQISDVLILPSTHYRLAMTNTDDDGQREVQGFTLSRIAADEEELLLIGVRPRFRGRGIGSGLMQSFCNDARRRGARHLFLEMRQGNEARSLYESLGFVCVNHRKNYYRRADNGPIDALTFKMTL